MTAIIRTALAVAALATLMSPVLAEDRSVLHQCRDVVKRAEKQAGSVSDAELARCRQVIREWALRDARTTVDQDGKPLR